MSGRTNSVRRSAAQAGGPVALEHQEGDALSVLDTEEATLRLYAQAGADPEAPPGPHALARMLGVDVRYDARQLLGRSRANYDRSRDVVWMRPGLSLPVEAFLLFHELAERELLPLGRSETHEHLCDQLAFRLRMPAPAFAWVARQEGPRWTALARPWIASHVGAGLRWGEVTQEPTAVVTAAGVRFRGEPWDWPEERDLRACLDAGDLPRTHVDRVRGGVVLRAR